MVTSKSGSIIFNKALSLPPNLEFSSCNSPLLGALLAQKLNVPVVNLGIMGSGNDAIYRRATEYYYLNKTTNSKPFFIVAFSQALRREEYLAEYKGTTVGDFRTLACYGDEPIERAIYEHIDTNGVYFMERRKLMHWLSIIMQFLL